MAEKNKKMEVAYKVFQISSLNFSCKDLDANKVAQLFEKEDSLALNINSSVQIKEEQSELIIDIETHLKEQKDVTSFLIKHKGRTVFKIKNLADFYRKKEGVIDISDRFMMQVFGLAYSHCRALLAVEISLTPYKDYFMLPVIHPREFLKGTRFKPAQERS